MTHKNIADALEKERGQIPSEFDAKSGYAIKSFPFQGNE